jgi:surface polysaccharide O-acyltransferase-like enzyme
MNTYISAKLRVLSFMAMVMIVYLHSYNLVVHFNTGDIKTTRGYNYLIQAFISNGVTRIAVPLFAAISGFLYFFSIEETFNSFLTKYKKRFKTLVLPYLIWSAWGLVFFYILQLIPQSRPYFTKYLIGSYSIEKLLNTLFLDPLPYQLWFLRDLIVIVSLAPLLYILIKRLKIFFVLVIMIVWYQGYYIFIVSSETLFFFIAGAYLAIHHKQRFLQSRFTKLPLVTTVVWFLLIALKTYLAYVNNNSFIDLALIRLFILMGLFSVWYGYDVWLGNKDITKSKFYPYCAFSFFLYAFHEPMLTIIKKALFAVLSKTQAHEFLIYIFSPVIVIALALVIGSILKRYLTSFYELITGGR